MANFTERLLRAAKLDATLYEEVETDPGALRQATVAVVLSSVAAAIGSSAHQLSVGGWIAGVIVSLLAWFVWAYLTYLIGTKIFPEPTTQADWGQLLRTTGFSSAPGLIRVLGILPGLAGVVFALAAIWMLVAMVVAVRQALDYKSTLRAVAVCVIGWVIQALILVLFFSLTETPLGGIPP